jgi:hypothetical protein
VVGVSLAQAADLKAFIAGARRVAALNALVPPQRKMILIVEPADPEKVKQLLDLAADEGIPIESYIGHPATAEFLSKLLEREIPANRAMYTPEPGDVAIVARLKKRLQPGEDVTEPEKLKELLEFYIVKYMPA